MQGKSQDSTKFRKTYDNVDYNDFILNSKNKRLYKMVCMTCGADRGHKIHNEALRSCLSCHTLKQTKKTKEQKKIYCSMKSNINARFFARKINKDLGAFRWLPYSLDDLMKHLESQFESWMNWDNHGVYNKNIKTWQIDHIIADANFKYSNVLDQGFKDSWALNNLRPLESMANIMKSDK